MDDFPRTTVGGVSVSRMIIGTNWFLGFSHTSAAKDKLINSTMDAPAVAEVIVAFMERGVDAIIGGPEPKLIEAVRRAEDRTGRKVTLILTPGFNILPGGPAEEEPEAVFDKCKEYGATFCLPHTSVTDRLLDTMHGTIRDYDRYAKMMRDRGMIPGLSTHRPEAITIADRSGADVETYVQLYNAAGFLMSAEADWIMKIIRGAKKPVLTIKPLAAGRLLPPVGLVFVWNTIRDVDMVAIGTATPDEAREVIDLSLDYLSGALRQHPLQTTRSKRVLVGD